jgi:trigger factor
MQHQHGDHAHSVRVAMLVTKVEKMALPSLDDAFVTKITGGKTTTADAFLGDLRKDIEGYWGEQSDRKVNDALAQAIVKAHEFLVPESLTDGFLDTFVDDIKNRSRDKQLPRGFNEQKFREESREYAAWQAKWFLLKDRIAEEEKITVDDTDFEQLAEKDASRMGIPKERILEYYKSAREVSERIQSDKLMKILRDHAKITNVEMKEEEGA